MWEKKESNNPEMFIAFFNYYINRNRFSGISIDKERKGTEETIELSDPHSVKIVGYMNKAVHYDTGDILIATGYLDEGLLIAPNRLDMHFGKIHILNEVGFYEISGNELFATLNISKKINNEWLWANNEKIEDGERFFINNLQDYYGLWLNAKTIEAYNQVKLCAEKQLELYPENIYAYNILAVYYSINEEFQKALQCFSQAKKINPNDCMVLINIGRTYQNMNNTNKSEEYYRRVIEIGNEQEKQQAQYYLDQL
jgi:tetratricopeptide (TPR) repeat protein